jgi:DNA-binding response OmpR family regulator
MKKTILLADHDPAVRRMLCRVLAGENYHVLLAGNGEEILDLFDGARIDLVLVERNLPLKSGRDAFEWLSAENPSVPLILITAQPHQIAKAPAPGVGVSMEKPLDLAKLLSVIRGLLRSETSLGPEVNESVSQ